MDPSSDSVSLRRWSARDRPLLDWGNARSMNRYLVSTESSAEVDDRHRRYLAGWVDGSSRMFAIDLRHRAVGAIGYWPTDWHGDHVWEAGWFVVPAAQGGGVAGKAIHRLLGAVREDGRRPAIMAFPSVENLASNRLCERAGFLRAGSEEFPFRGAVLRVNAWRLDL